MTDLLREYLPTAPDLGLYVDPDIPASKLKAAIGDYARDVDPGFDQFPGALIAGCCGSECGDDLGVSHASPSLWI